MSTPQKHDYNGYTIWVGATAPTVSVFDHRQTSHGHWGRVAVYQTSSLDLAMKWVDAYRASEIWAIAARMH